MEEAFKMFRLMVFNVLTGTKTTIQKISPLYLQETNGYFPLLTI